MVANQAKIKASTKELKTLALARNSTVVSLNRPRFDAASL